MSDPLVSVDWLARRLDDPSVRVVDASWHMPATGRSGAAEFAEAHIPGAVFFDIDALSDPASDLPHMLPTPGAFAEAAGALGLAREATIVAYDSLGIFSAPRAWWSLRVMGWSDVRVLDGGLPAWRAAGRPVSSAPERPAPVRISPDFDPDLVLDLSEVRGMLQAGGQVADARPAPRFRGEAPEPRPGLRAGHMPGARNLPFADLLDANGLMAAPDALAARFEAAGLDPARPLAATCGSGVTACIIALAVARLGGHAAVYDGSWAEWGGRSDTLVATGP